MRIVFFLALILISNLLLSQSFAQNSENEKELFPETNSIFRNWWDVRYYSMQINPDIVNQTLSGSVRIDFTVNSNWLNNSVKKNYMQIDLHSPLEIDSVFFENEKLENIERKYYHLYLLDFNQSMESRIEDVLDKDSLLHLKIYYSGKPKTAITPPWDGGMIWGKDSLKRDWIAVACQGVGAGIWFPCKDIEYDEPDNGVEMFIHAPKKLVAVSNGNLVDVTTEDDVDIYHWRVTYPINIYNITMDIGYYTCFEETYTNQASDKKLKCTYYILDYEFNKAKKQFGQVQKLLSCFEKWFGEYPFQRDGYKVVQTPFLGMEHQSAIAYGNGFENGYLGRDLSKTGWGYKFDFILIHESGHEWFGNAISSYDIADMWIHEAFTTYSEALYLETYYGKKAAEKYVIGIRCKIKNDIPVIGVYNQRTEGSGDMYFKGANILQMYREILNDDKLFKEMLIGMNQFWYKTTTTKEIEAYLNKFSNANLKFDFSKMFDQYLRTIQIPILEVKESEGERFVRWTNCVLGFDMPLKLKNGSFIEPTTEWTSIKKGLFQLKIDPSFYIQIKKVAD